MSFKTISTALQAAMQSCLPPGAMGSRIGILEVRLFIGSHVADIVPHSVQGAPIFMASYLVAALLIGVIAGLRTMTAPAAVSWAAHLGWIDLSSSWLAFLGYAWTPYILTVLALAELVADQLPATPSRKVPQQFGARLVSGALCGAALGVTGGSLALGLVTGVVGAVIGTLGGASVRSKLAGVFGKDPPAAFIEDAVAILGAWVIVASL